MNKEGMNYPLHLGVTEAGDGEDGRIKSAVGIGALLEDGLGDTIRVSLTEEPEYEIPVAKFLVDRYHNRNKSKKFLNKTNIPYDPYFHIRRSTSTIHNIGGKNVPRVFSDLSNLNNITPNSLAALGYLYSEKEDKWHISDQAVDYILIGKNNLGFERPGLATTIQHHSIWNKESASFPIFTMNSYKNSSNRSDILNFILIQEEFSEEIKLILKNDDSLVIILNNNEKHIIMNHRSFIIELINNRLQTPVIIQKNYELDLASDFQLDCAIDLGSLMIDGLVDGINVQYSPDISLSNQTSFGVLQASRLRISKTEYISCPSCGRTLFDLQSTTNEIRSVTDHLKGVKIGIMGCIVNGPGEMADADYGYVGTGVGKISLYKGQEVVKKNIPTQEAVNALINLIKDNGDWIDPR
jgi:(E)-4-hydroxy-3-methylbut-2-enyl-diphosphate synthase